MLALRATQDVEQLLEHVLEQVLHGEEQICCRDPTVEPYSVAACNKVRWLGISYIWGRSRER